jgi:hypothetical protein
MASSLRGERANDLFLGLARRDRVDREQRIHARDLILRRRRRATDPRRQLLDVGALELNVSLGAAARRHRQRCRPSRPRDEVVELPIDPRRCGLDEMPLRLERLRGRLGNRIGQAPRQLRRVLRRLRLDARRLLARAGDDGVSLVGERRELPLHGGAILGLGRRR